VVETYEDLATTVGINGEFYYIASGDYENVVYQYTTGLGFVETAFTGFVTHKSKQPKHSLPIYEILKDGGEVLGLNLILPFRVGKGYENNIILGDMLVKDSALLKPRATAKNIYLQTRTTRFEEFETSNIGVNDNLTLLPTEFVLTNQIIVPATIRAYDYFAITDIDGNVYLLVNQRNLDGTLTDMSTIYFHLLDIEDFVEPRATVYDLNIELEMFESDRITATFNFQENEVFDIEMVESDSIVAIFNFRENELIAAALRDSDVIAATMNFVDNTATPTAQYITTSGGEHTFRVYNNDSIAAYIYADENSSPTANRGLVASGAYVTVYLTDFPIEIEACYAKAKADGKNYSAITSASSEGA
jgi:hypothetical protein